MSELSPAAQAVLDAFRSSHTGQGCLAAALRAAANEAQKLIFMTTPSTDWGKGWKEGVRDAANGLFAIADELESH